MRKVLISLLLLLFVAQANAQVKAAADAVKALDKVKAEVANPKKAANPASWVKLGTAFADCYDAPIKGLWQGASQMEAKMLLKDQQILASGQEEKNPFPGVLFPWWNDDIWVILLLPLSYV